MSEDEEHPTIEEQLKRIRAEKIELDEEMKTEVKRRCSKEFKNPAEVNACIFGARFQWESFKKVAKEYHR